MFEQLAGNPAALSYLLGTMGQAVAAPNTWQQRVGGAAAGIGGQIQQARALGGLLGQGQATTPGTIPGQAGSNPLIARSGADVMGTSGQLEEVGGMGYVPPTSVQSQPAGQGALPLSQGMGVNPSTLAAFSLLSRGWGGSGFNVPPELFSPVNALGADLPNALKTATTVQLAQDQLSGARDIRQAIIKDSIEGRREDARYRLALRQENLRLQLQEMKDQAADERLDRRERAAAERQARQIEATLAGIDKRMAREKWGAPFAGVDDQGNPAMFRPNAQGGVEQIPGVRPPSTAQDRLGLSALTSMLKADTTLIENMGDKDPERPAALERIKRTRAAIEALGAQKAGTAPPAGGGVVPRPRATNPQTGEVVEWDGKAWQPVK